MVFSSPAFLQIVFSTDVLLQMWCCGSSSSRIVYCCVLISVYGVLFEPVCFVGFFQQFSQGFFSAGFSPGRGVPPLPKFHLFCWPLVSVCISVKVSDCSVIVFIIYYMACTAGRIPSVIVFIIYYMVGVHSRPYHPSIFLLV